MDRHDGTGTRPALRTPWFLALLIASITVSLALGWFAGRWYQAQPTRAEGVLSVSTSGDGTFQTEDGQNALYPGRLRWTGRDGVIGDGRPPCIQEDRTSAHDYRAEVTYQPIETPDSGGGLVATWIDCGDVEPRR